MLLWGFDIIWVSCLVQEPTLESLRMENTSKIIESNPKPCCAH